ncbi:MAG: response regulator [Polyangiaceae bacterium]
MLSERPLSPGQLKWPVAPVVGSKVFLLPGDFEVVTKPSILSTLLGSCVSVCLSHRDGRVAAMNHFLLPGSPDGVPTDVGRFGYPSTRAMLKKAFAVDPDPSHFTAKLFGGGAVLARYGVDGHVGASNVKAARNVLRELGVRIVHEDVGGTRGRYIDFDTARDTVESRLLSSGSIPPERPARRAPTVLLVDDSQLARRVLRRALHGHRGLRVVGEASDAFEAREQILLLEPDVVLLDLELPQMDGLTFLRHLMTHHPKPVVILSSLGADAREVERRARAYGALEVLDKQRLGSIGALRDHLVPALERASGMADSSRGCFASMAPPRG